MRGAGDLISQLVLLGPSDSPILLSEGPQALNMSFNTVSAEEETLLCGSTDPEPQSSPLKRHTCLH